MMSAKGVLGSVSFWFMPFRVMANAIVAVAISPIEASPAADRIRMLSFGSHTFQFSYSVK
jgi:hypothetical protein